MTSSARALTLALLLAPVAFPASAHFQEIIPSADILADGGTVDVSLVFTHPFEGGPVMTMAKPTAVGILKDGEKRDLSGKLVEKPVGKAMTYSFTHELAEPGASIFYIEPAPYWEPAEGKYIIHYSKVVVDSYASGDGWDASVGFPVEIVPLSNPTGLWTGNLFTGIVTKGGEPVPFAEIEVEVINDQGIKAPNDAYITQVIKADANGTFSYAMPFAGWWGFAALIDGDKPMTSPDGKSVPVELGALIWVNAKSAQ
ncbi:DUF4198 domain-containing protein [Cohaesibacter intestini]|uniref:DUF4198 domain-containing protein n=1 Tax=Cohaesibacter intestini TaxID=2211145 RepID=UPI000DEAFC47|nr:DUF4198 domain-containing protein [Cohaesibacter intestini]